MGTQDTSNRKHRKINRTLPQLKRNAACAPCRRRRVKCDGARPVCASCLRSYQFLARTQPNLERDSKGVQCYYDEGDGFDEDDSYPAQQASMVRSTPTSASAVESGSGSGSIGIATGPAASVQTVHSAFGGESSGGAGKRRERDDEEDNPYAKVHKLEAKIAELQHALLAASGGASTGASSHSSSGRGFIGPGFTSPVEDPLIFMPPGRHYPNPVYQPPPPTVQQQQPRSHRRQAPSSQPTEPPPLLQSQPLHHGPPMHTPSTAVSPLVTSALVTSPLQPFGTGQPGPGVSVDGSTESAPVGAGLIDGDSGQIGGPFVDIFWPGWPKRLPTPSMLDHLVFTFFSAIPLSSRLIHRQTFLARLSLPPSHTDFPHPALLHAICCVAARYSAAVRVNSVSGLVQKTGTVPKPGSIDRGPGRATWDEEAASETDFAEKHYKYCMQEMRYDNCRPNQLFEILQAQLVLKQYISQTAKWLEGWVMSGTVARLAIGLGLMDETAYANIEGNKSKSTILPPPRTDQEREERRALAVYNVAMDACFSAAGRWPNTLPLDEMFVTLPASKMDFLEPHGRIPENPQRLDSADIFRHHPVADGFILSIKAALLLGHVSKFVRTLKHLGIKDKEVARQTPEFLKLETDLNDFNRTFPASLRDPLQPCPGYANRLDADLINAHVMHRIAAIMLHEPFADVKDPSCPSANRLLVEAKACVGIMFLIMSTASDIALNLYPETSIWFFHAARTMLLFYHRALELQDTMSAQALLGEIEVLQMSFSALGNRFSMGVVHCGMLDAIIKRIHAEFGLPDQNWKWTPKDWAEGLQRSSSLNFREGMRATNPQFPLLPPTNPDAMMWGDSGRRLTYTQIADQQRLFVGKAAEGGLGYTPFTYGTGNLDPGMPAFSGTQD